MTRQNEQGDGDGTTAETAVVFELCAETLQACQIAQGAGAARIELCADLLVDGLTPDPALIRAAVAQSGLPVFPLLRPRAGDFVYTADEFARMRADLIAARALGVSGFALGVLLPDGRVDVPRTRELVELAAPLDVTFHRAFDVTPDLAAALEDVIATGCRRVLTSGGAANVVDGTQALAALVQQAAGRIAIAAGGGVRAENAEALAQQTGTHHFHGSVRQTGAPSLRTPSDGNGTANAAAAHSQPPQVGRIDPRAVRAVVDALHRGVAEHQAT